MDDLIAFLLAQIDADERDACAAFSGQADPENGWGESRTPGYAGVTITPHVGHVHEDVQAAHIVKWNPGRALAEVDAKRRIIEHVSGSIEALDASDPDQRVSIADLTHVLRLLALPDAGHPDYRAEWRPGA